MKDIEFDPNDFPTGNPDHDKDGFKSWRVGIYTYMEHPGRKRYKIWTVGDISYTTDYQTGLTSTYTVKCR
jgi:hypothetical protein